MSQSARCAAEYVTDNLDKRQSLGDTMSSLGVKADLFRDDLSLCALKALGCRAIIRSACQEEP